jgi:hypothetical protein
MIRSDVRMWNGTLLRGMQPQHYIEPDCVGAKFSGREPGLAAQAIQNNLLPWIEVG